jgi:hypothetical protein
MESMLSIDEKEESMESMLSIDEKEESSVAYLSFFIVAAAGCVWCILYQCKKIMFINEAIDEKKKSIREAVEAIDFLEAVTTLGNATASETAIAMDAMEKIHTTVADGFQDDGDSKGEFMGDSHFKLEIVSVNVLQVIIDAIKAD